MNMAALRLAMPSDVRPLRGLCGRPTLNMNWNRLSVAGMVVLLKRGPGPTAQCLSVAPVGGWELCGQPALFHRRFAADTLKDSCR